MFQTILTKEMIGLKTMSVDTVLSIIHTKYEKFHTHQKIYLKKNMQIIKLTINQVTKAGHLS